MIYLIYLLICCAILLVLIFYGIRWQRQKQDELRDASPDERL